MSLNRRTLVSGAAWAAPAVLASATIPAYAASSSSEVSQGNSGGGSLPAPSSPATSSACAKASWHTGAQINLKTSDYSNRNYLNKVNYNTSPSGEAEMQHWYEANEEKLYWRFHIGMPTGAEAGATITFPFDKSWTNPSVPTQSGLNAFLRFAPHQPSLYTTDMPTAVVAQTADSFVLTFMTAIPAGAAGVFLFTASPVGGNEAVQAGTVYEAWATVDFVPATC